MMLTKSDKQHIVILSLLLSKFLSIFIPMLFFLTVGLNSYYYIVFVGAIPFFLTTAEFYKIADKFNKKSIKTKLDILEIVLFVIFVAYWIIGMFTFR